MINKQLVLITLLFLIQVENVSAQENRVDISTFEITMRDHAKTYENAWSYWGLTQVEWKQYESIKQNSPWGVWKNDATPLAILSHYATSPAEKIRYARLEAELDQWRENTALEFQQIYNKQREIVFAKNAAVMNGRKPDVKNIRPSDRILYFAEAGECNTRCRAVTNRLLGTSAHIDIFLMGAKDEKAIFAWAASAAIPVDRVHVKQITLNFENNYLVAVTTTPKTILQFPVAYLQGKNDYEAIIF